MFPVDAVTWGDRLVLYILIVLPFSQVLDLGAKFIDREDG